MASDDMARLFISRDRLDNWVSEDRIKVEGDVMTLSGDSRFFKLKPAVRFMKVASGTEDPLALLGKVKTVADIMKQLGGEYYMDSVLIGDVAYDVQSGFIGEPQVG